MQSFHLRADLDEVAAVVCEHLGAEGFTPSESHDAHDPSVRRIAFYAQDGWVGIAEEGFSSAEWGPVLSETLGTEVITLAGECDHAFYTHVFVHEAGAEKHVARVPEDITLDDDGQHRLRAGFLGQPLVVDELGGEENMQVIGDALGVPRPRFNPYEGEPDLTLYFAYTSDAPPKAPDFAKLFGLEAGEIAEFQSVLGGLTGGLAPAGRAVFGVRSRTTDGPPRLAPTQESTNIQGFAAGAGHVHGSFLLEDVESARGLSVSLYGDGLTLFEPRRLRARVGEREWTVEAGGAREGLITFSLPDVELTQPPPRPDTSHLPLEERLRQGVKRLGTMSARGANEAEVTVWIEGDFVAAGEGELALTAQLVGHASSAATTEIALKVKAAVRRPVLPAGAPTPHPVYVESYDSRDVAFGWVGFDAAWPEVRETVLRIASEAEQALREATGASKLEGHAQLRSGKRLTLKKDIWRMAEDALVGGADVSLTLGKLLEGASLDIVHQIDGPNIVPTLGWSAERPPAVWLAWWCPRPDSESGVRALATLAERALVIAGEHPHHLGGLASAQGERGFGTFDTAFDTLAQLRDRTNSASWLRTHARAPGWRVLLPPGAPGAERVLRSPAPDPFAYSPEDAERMERLVVPLLG